MAGTIPISLTQRFDSTTHVPLSGGLIYFIQAGTTATPQNAFQDAALTILYPNPIVLDSGGNIPQLFFADGAIKIRITNSAGTTQFTQDNILVIGASVGNATVSTVDPATILTTGDIKTTYGTGVITGFVRANGRTMGNASSGATERANADTSALFQYLWGVDANLAVSGGRGANAAADYAANKTITLPDARGRVLAGLDDMGSTTAGRLSSTYFGATATTLGATGGGESTTLVTANLPAYTPAGSAAVSVTTTGNILTGTVSTNAFNFGAGAGIFGTFLTSSTSSQQTSTGTGTFTGTAQGGISTPARTVPPMILATVYLKL